MAITTQQVLAQLDRALDAYDMESMLSVTADDVVHHVGGRGELAGTYRGKEEIKRFFVGLMERSARTGRSPVADGAACGAGGSARAAVAAGLDPDAAKLVEGVRPAETRAFLAGDGYGVWLRRGRTEKEGHVSDYDYLILARVENDKYVESWTLFLEDNVQAGSAPSAPAGSR